MNPLVSVIIPTYNCSTFVGETLNSLQIQSYANWEAICVDDGSTDNTQAVVQKYATLDSRIKLISRKELPKGGSSCRNVGIEYVSGDYIIFLDGDDMLVPSCIEKRLAQIHMTKYDFAVFSMGTIKDGVIGKVITDSRITDYKSAFASNHAVWQITSPIYRASFVRMLGGFDTTFQRMQDLEFGLRAIVASRGNFLSCIDDNHPDCYYRLSNSIVTAQKYILGLQQFDKFVCLLRHLESEGNFSDKEKLSSIYLCLALSSLIIYLRKGVYDCMKFESIFTTYSLTEKMNLKDRIIFKGVSLLSPFKKLQSVTVRCIRRCVMNSRFIETV